MTKGKQTLSVIAIALTGAWLGMPGTALAQPVAPTSVTATLQAGTNQAAAPNAVTVNWIDPDTTITSYNILRSTSASGPFNAIASGVSPASLSSVALTGNCEGTNILDYVDATVVLGVQYYYYEVVAVSGSGSSTSSVAAVTYGNGNVLVNAGFEAGQAVSGNGDIGPGFVPAWNVVGDSADTYGFLNTAVNTYYDNPSGACPVDPIAENVIIFDSTYVAKLWPNGPNGYYRQSVSVPGGTWAGGGWTISSHEDLLAGGNIFYYEIDFYDGGSNLLAAYQSLVVTNLTCTETTPFYVDNWQYLNVTNQMQVTGGSNTGVVIGNTGSLGVITAPPNTASIQFAANLIGNGGGSVSFDDCVLDEIVAPVLSLPAISSLSPAGILFSTSTNFSCTVTSSDSVVTNVQLIVTSSALGGAAATVTNPAGTSVTGLGTASVSVNMALTPNVIYSVSVHATDGYGLGNVAATKFDTLAPALVIEGADFNYNNGTSLDTPADGGLGLYYNVAGAQGVDENWNRNAASPANDSYRPSDNVTIEPAAPNNGEELKFATISPALLASDPWDVPQEIGFALAGNWLNYTRTYGSAPADSAPAGLYNVYADLAFGGGGTSGVKLYQVTGDITSSANQVSNLIGTFSANNTGGWNTYAYVPLRNAFGNNLADVSLSGQATLRLAATGNTPNIGFIFLVPSTAGQAPTVTAEYPDGALPYEPTNAFTFTLDAGFATNGTAASLTAGEVGITLNGVNVTGSATLSSTANGLTGSVPLPFENQYTAVVAATNSAGLASTSTVTFLNLNPNDYAVEFSDYDFSTYNGSAWVSGQFIDNAAPSGDSYNELAPPIYEGTLAANSYFEYPTGFTPSTDPQGIGAIARQGVDINYKENGQTGANAIYYRIDKNTSVGNNNNVGMQPADDVTDNYRPKVSNARTLFSDPNIGGFNLGYCPAGGWLNYTRTFPAGNYYAWGRFADGAGGGFVNTVSLVTSGVGTSNQTTQTLGAFTGNPTGGWTTYAWFPLRDTHGNLVNLTMGGKETLRLTLTAPNDNPLFVQFAAAPPQVTLTASIVGGQLSLSFQSESGHNYKVLYTPTLSPASWTQVGSTITGDGTVKTVTEPLSGGQGYFVVEGQ